MDFARVLLFFAFTFQHFQPCTLLYTLMDAETLLFPLIVFILLFHRCCKLGTRPHLVCVKLLDAYSLMIDYFGHANEFILESICSPCEIISW